VNAPGDGADVPIRLLDAHPVTQPPDGLVVVRRPAWVLALEIGRQPQIHVSGKSKPGREHTDDGVDRAVDLQV
jgi:hypothetical protein